MRTHPIGKTRSKTCERAMWLLAAVVFLLPSAAWAATASVNCDTGGSINAALAGFDLQGPNTINVTGTCHENIFIIDTERLTIQGPASIVAADPTDNVIFIFRSRSILFRRLTISGGVEGVLIQRSEVQMNDSTIQNNSDFGVITTQQSSLQFVRGVVQNNAGGIVLNQTSRAGINGGTIQNNATDGIELANTSFANIVSVTIQNNGGHGILAFHTSTFQLSDSTVVGNGSTGIRAQETSHAEIFGNIIRNNGASDPSSPGGVVLSEGAEGFIENGNDISFNAGPGILVMTHGTLSSLGGNTISNNTAGGVSLRRQSVGQFFASDAISANGGSNLACDTTSLAAGDLTGVTNIRCMNIERELGPPRPGHILDFPASTLP